MGLPPRPRGRPLVRRALVASVLVTGGCAQGAKPAPAPERESVPVAPQVAVERDPQPPAPPPEVERAPPEVAPQVAFELGFTLELIDSAKKPLANLAVKVTTSSGETIEATTSARGDVYINARLRGSTTVSIEAPGFQAARHTVHHDLKSRVVLKRKAKR